MLEVEIREGILTLMEELQALIGTLNKHPLPHFLITYPSVDMYCIKGARRVSKRKHIEGSTTGCFEVRRIVLSRAPRQARIPRAMSLCPE